MTSREVMKWKAPLWKRLHYVLLVERKRAKRLVLALRAYAGVPLVAVTVFWRRPFTFRYKPWRAWVYASVMARLRMGKSVPMRFPQNHFARIVDMGKSGDLAGAQEAYREYCRNGGD